MTTSESWAKNCLANRTRSKAAPKSTLSAKAAYICGWPKHIASEAGKAICSFFSPLRLYPVQLISATALITLAITLLFARLDQISSENAIGAMVLAAEAQAEIGPDLRAAAKQHFELSQYFTTRRKPDAITAISSYLDASIDRNRNVSPAVVKLFATFADPDADDDKLLQAIQRFAGDLKHYGNSVRARESFVGLESILASKPKFLSSAERHGIDSAIESFIGSVEILKSEPTFEKAHQACLLSREASAKLFIEWNAYDINRAESRKAVDELGRALEGSLETIRRIEGSPAEKEMLNRYISSLTRRRDLLNLFKKGNLQKTFEYLSQSCENHVATVK